jgi:curved DNA-binding protein CbpA
MHLQQRPSHHAQSHRHTRTRVRCGSAQQDLYAVLGVAYDADAAAIRAAFRAKAKETHPDVLGGEEAAFRLVKRAHEVLSDAMLRANHDMELREAAGDGDAAAALRARDPRFARWALRAVGRGGHGWWCASCASCDSVFGAPAAAGSRDASLGRPTSRTLRAHAAVHTGLSAGAGRSCPTSTRSSTSGRPRCWAC